MPKSEGRSGASPLGSRWLPSVGPRDLRALVAIVEHGSFRAAARVLGYAPSAVSKQIASLERELGATLLTRPPGGQLVSLTAAGEIVYGRARRILAEITALQAELGARDHDARATVRVASFQSGMRLLLPEALEIFRERAPQVEVLLSQRVDNPTTLAQLTAGELDLALLVNPPADDRVTSVLLLEDSWGILTASGSALARTPRPSFDLLDGADVVAWTEGWEVQRDLERAWRRRGIRPRVVSRTDDVTVMQQLVAAGHGHAMFSRLGAAVAPEPGLAWVEPEEPLLARAVTLCYPAGRRLAPAVRTLAEAIRGVARSRSSSGWGGTSG